MLNQKKHKLILIQILKDIYTNIKIAPFLGFKGGTAAYLFYDLPRFSVDLDFDLLDISTEKKNLVMKEIEEILCTYGEIKNKFQKRFTLFFLLSYGNGEHNIKIEISTRNLKSKYVLKEYLGISMLVINKTELFTYKLIALANRTNLAMRDVFDVWFFLKNNYDFDKNIICKWTTKSLKDYLEICIAIIEKLKDRQMLEGLGELLDEKMKIFVKNKLKAELIFLLKARI